MGRSSSRRCASITNCPQNSAFWNDASSKFYSRPISLSRLPRTHHPKDTMNQIKLSLRAADDPRTIKEEASVPIFASVFSLHNVTKTGREDKEAIPLTVKASQELARTLVTELRKGVAFVLEGKLAYFKNPENQSGNLFDFGRSHHRHHPAKIHSDQSKLTP